MFKLIKILIIWAVILSATGVTYVYAASNTNPAAIAGQGASQTGGYVVSNIDYRLANDPTRLNAVDLDLDQPASIVMIKLIAADSQYYQCVNTNANHWQCDVKQINISSVDEMSVIAISN